MLLLASGAKPWQADATLKQRDYCFIDRKYVFVVWKDAYVKCQLIFEVLFFVLFCLLLLSLPAD